MNEVEIVDVVGYVDALVERVPNSCGLDGGCGVLVVVNVVVEDMVLFSFLGGQESGGSFSLIIFGLVRFRVLGSWFE